MGQVHVTQISAAHSELSPMVAILMASCCAIRFSLPPILCNLCSPRWQYALYTLAYTLGSTLLSLWKATFLPLTQPYQRLEDSVDQTCWVGIGWVDGCCLIQMGHDQTPRPYYVQALPHHCSSLQIYLERETKQERFILLVASQRSVSPLSVVSIDT